MTFLLPMDESTDSFQKSCNARVYFVLICFSRFFKNSFIFSFYIEFYPLLKLWMKGPGYFNKNTFILQQKIVVFLSGWLGKAKGVILV